MKRLFLFFSLMILIFLFSACSDQDKTSPNERFDEYVKLWNKQEFDKMYKMLTTEARQTYSKEQFIDRYKKIYEDLKINHLKITFDELDKDKIKEAKKAEEVTIPFNAEMDSIAGKISFTYEAKLIKQGEEEEKQDWFVEWNPGFIFPDINDGGEIGLEIIEPKRGEILDRNMMPLALNGLVWEIGVVPETFNVNLEQNKERLASLLQISSKAIDSALNQSWVQPELFVPIKKISTEDEALLNQLLTIEGVMSQEVPGRIYPAGKAAAHITGYIAKVNAEDLEKLDSTVYGPNDMVGKTGLEKIYEKQLKGERGAKIIIKKDGEEDTVLAEKPVRDGENITVTIDINIQEKVFNTYDDLAGTTAIIDSKTGETLALVSSPAYNPNDMVYGISQNKWDELQNDPQLPLLNRFAATYAPGSVMKPISAAIGLENGTIKPNEGIEINGLTWSNGKGWGDYKVRRVSGSNKPVDVTDALVRSDNIYFAMQAVKMGADAYIEGLKQFGIGEEFPYAYPINDSSISVDGKLDNEVLLANTSYGQGEVELSSLHLATAYTAFLNDGNMIKPTLLLSEDTGQVWKEGLVSKENAKIIKDALRKVVTEGTAQVANKAKIPIAGKTGTAELKLQNDEKGEENGWFVGYPSDDEDIIIAMMMEKVQDKGTSTLVTKKVADILTEIKKK